MLSEALIALAAAVNALAVAAQGKNLISSQPPTQTVAPHPANNSRIRYSVTELISEFLRAKARIGSSDRYLRQLRVTLKAFAAGRGNKDLENITPGEIEKFISNHNWSVRTRRSYLNDVKNLLGFAVRRDYLVKNPALGVELPAANGATGEIAIHTPEEVAQVLEHARRANLSVCRLLAIRYFCGVRSAEAKRLCEKDLKLDQSLVEVTAMNSKTRSRRLITIQPNLHKWLALGGELGPVGDMTIRKVIAGAGVKWRHNVTRHSFVSYHLARFGSSAKTAMEAGHSEAMLFRHYRALVTPAQGEVYWQIVPK